jgi:hypothetical protein
LGKGGVSKRAATDEMARVADALGWEIPDAAGFSASPRSLLRFGDLLPLHGRSRR